MDQNETPQTRWLQPQPGRRFSGNRLEDHVARKFHDEGWAVYRHGWPDFLFEKDGRLRFVEVKSRSTFVGRRGQRLSKSSKLSRSQKRIHKALRDAGIEVEVVYVDDCGNAVKPGGIPKHDAIMPWSEVLSSG